MDSRLFRNKPKKHPSSSMIFRGGQQGTMVFTLFFVKCFTCLVVLTILKNMKVNGKDYPIYEMENKKCSKPPTK
jgi:hypothetical protein